MVVSGHCHIEPNCFLGVNSTVGHQVRIAQGTLLGAGATVTRDTEPNGVYMPAKICEARRHQRPHHAVPCAGAVWVTASPPSGRQHVGSNARLDPVGRVAAGRTARELTTRPETTTTGPTSRGSISIPIAGSRSSAASAVAGARHPVTVGCSTTAGSRWDASSSGRRASCCTTSGGTCASPCRGRTRSGSAVPPACRRASSRRSGAGDGAQRGGSVLAVVSIDPRRPRASMVMWYGTNDGWGSAQRPMVHSVARATSIDGRAVGPRRRSRAAPRSPVEYAISRPMVRRTASGYEMYYCCRASGARRRIASDARRRPTVDVGPARCRDRLRRRRRRGGTARCCATRFVFDHAGETYMLYNGTGYGRTGFGIAELDEP